MPRPPAGEADALDLPRRTPAADGGGGWARRAVRALTPRRLRLWAFGFLTATATAAVYASQNQFWWKGLPAQRSWLRWFLLQLPPWYAWLLAVPAVFWATRRFPVHGPRRWRNLLLHTAFGTAFLWVNDAVGNLLLVPQLGRAWGEQSFLAWTTTDAWRNVVYVLPMYLTTVGVAHAVYWYRERERREVGEARVQTELERTRRNALRVQLRPAFLFDTLHAVSALMESDVLRARRMIAQLSTLLRLGLEDDGRHEIPLEEEIDLADRYAEIQKLRLGGKLEVVYDVAADARRVVVPRLILHPLIESAAAHGGAGERPTTISVQARRSGERLLLWVTDDGGDGDACANDDAVGETRARLEETYGDEALVEASAAPSGRTVRLELPARTAARPAPPAGAPDDEGWAPSGGDWDDPARRWAADGGRGRGRRWEVYLAAFAIATGLAVLRSVYNYEVGRGSPDAFRFGYFLGRYLIAFYLWLAATPLVFWLARRLPVHGRDRARNLALHLPLSVAVFFCVYLLSAVADQPLLRPYGLEDARGTLLAVTLESCKASYVIYAPLYFGVLAIAHAVHASRDALRRRVREQRLRTLLERAHRDLLRMQLQPHFLFNTLHAVSALMASDVPAARRMIARLGDLLRLALDDDARHQVPLAEEIDFLDRYVQIQQIRFRGRLAVAYHVPDDARGVLVPRLVLQPLVENAIKHGLSRLERPGRVEVHAAVEGGRLLLRVLDDGEGLPGGVMARQGVGIGNTRARLEQLHGAAARMTIGNRDGGGCEVLIELPATTLEPGPESEPDRFERYQPIEA